MNTAERLELDRLVKENGVTDSTQEIRNRKHSRPLKDSVDKFKSQKIGLATVLMILVSEQLLLRTMGLMISSSVTFLILIYQALSS